MRSIMLSRSLALLLGLCLAASRFTLHPAPSLDLIPVVVAADETLTDCSWEAFERLLAAMQDDGGGTLTITCDGTILFEHEIVITTDVAIIGVGDVILDANGQKMRLFWVESNASLELVDLTLQNGDRNVSEGGPTAYRGGAIYNAGTLKVTGGALTNNEALEGGAIYNAGTLKVTGSALSNNKALDGGAISNGFTGTLEVRDSIFSANLANNATAIRNVGTMTIVASDFVDHPRNVIGNVGPATIIASTFSNNRGASFGGAIFNTDTLVVTASAFTGNRADQGGAIYNGVQGKATITASTFSDNEAGLGGAIFNRKTLVVTASTFTNNTALGTIDAGDGGGAIYNEADGSVTITASTFSSNRAVMSGGAISNTDFGALTVTASTFTNNTATQSHGGAIYTAYSATITASTFTSNQAQAGAGGAIYSANGTTSLTASIIADNSAPSGPTCAWSDDAPTSGGSNLSNDNSCNLGNDDFISNAIHLADLQDNGGPTPTMLPQPGSAAIGTADCARTTATDQRGVARAADLACDIGAAEAAGDVPVTLAAFVPTSATTGLAEGDRVDLRAIAFGPDNTNLRYTLDCDGDGSYETPITETASTVDLSCTLPDDGQLLLGIQVCDGHAPTTCDTGTLAEALQVANLPPTITGVSAELLTQGQARISVVADDPGSADQLTYRFDCDGDQLFETLSPGAEGICQLDLRQATLTIHVLAEDGDGGSDTESVTLHQTARLCARGATGVLGPPLANGSCPAGSTTLELPAAKPTTLCIHPYTGELTWAARGKCVPTLTEHVVPLDGPLSYCQHAYSGQLRHTPSGKCSSVERYGAIPA